MDKLSKNLKRATALMVAISMGGGVAFALHSKYGKTKTSDTVVNNVGKISNPQVPTSASDTWTGNYIYFGNYNVSPVKWKVLDNNNIAWDNSKNLVGNGFISGTIPDVSNYGRQNAPSKTANNLSNKNAMLLLADNCKPNIGGHMPSTSPLDTMGQICWAGSADGKKGCVYWAWLNGYGSEYVYDNTTIPSNPFINTAFGDKERDLVMWSKVYTEAFSNKANGNNIPPSILSDYTTLSEDRLFLLSVAEMRNIDYGFSSDDTAVNHRTNVGLLRVPAKFLDHPSHCEFQAIWENGAIAHEMASNGSSAPAMNLDISKILFVSKADDSNKPSDVSSVPTAFGMPTGYGNEYKLTVKDSSRNFAIGNVTQTGKVAEISYSGAQTGANEYISCIIANANDASDIKYYGKLDNAKSSGKVKIRIPDESSGYVIKLFNEQCNGANETDWASETQNLAIDSEGKVTTENYDVSNYAEVESIEIEPKSHSISGGGPAENTTVILRGKNFSSNYKVTIEFRVDGVEGSVLSYPAVFSDASSDTLTVKIPKSEMVKLNDHIGRYTVEAKVESN